MPPAAAKASAATTKRLKRQMPPVPDAEMDRSPDSGKKKKNSGVGTVASPGIHAARPSARADPQRAAAALPFSNPPLRHSSCWLITARACSSRTTPTPWPRERLEITPKLLRKGRPGACLVAYLLPIPTCRIGSFKQLSFDGIRSAIPPRSRTSEAFQGLLVLLVMRSTDHTDIDWSALPPIPSLPEEMVGT